MRTAEQLVRDIRQAAPLAPGLRDFIDENSLESTL